MAGYLVLRMPKPSQTALSDIRRGMRRMREPAAKLSLRNSAIENATKGQQWAPEAEKMFIEKTNLSD